MENLIIFALRKKWVSLGFRAAVYFIVTVVFMAVWSPFLANDLPVLIIKKDAGDFNVDKFVFASDFTDEIKKPFAKVVDIANKFGAELELAMINTPSTFKPTHVAEEIMRNFVSNFNINKYSINIYNDVNVENGILHFADHIGADLIGVSTHGRKGLSHFFNGSISEDLVNHALRPVITFKI